MSTDAPRRPYWPLVHLGLLLATLGTVFSAFLYNFSPGQGPEDIRGAAIFTFAVILVLGSHEMGHYLLARYHRVETSLPYFIPLPLLGFGTLGAVIRIRGRIPHRDALVDIGAAGPLAGFLVALPVLIAGLSHSHWMALPAGAGASQAQSLWEVVSRWGATSAEPAHGYVLLYGDNLLIKGLQRLVCGPTPPGHELLAHPLVMAGWFGTLVTALNLVPVG